MKKKIKDLTIEQFKSIVEKYATTDELKNSSRPDFYKIWGYTKLAPDGKREWLCFSYDLLCKIWKVGKFEGNSFEEALIRYLSNDRMEILQSKEFYHEQTNKMGDELFDLRCKYYINKIFHNKDKATTLVWFYDNTKIIVKRAKGTKDDVYTAVAFAIAKRMCGNNSRFQKYVDIRIKETLE